MKPEALISSNVLKYALILSVLIYLFSLVQRMPHIDDAWLGEVSYFQAKEGHPRSELMRGVTQQETRSLVHHKLMTLGGTVLSLLFGFKLITLKSLSLLFYLGFLVTFTTYLRKREIPPALPLLLIIVNSLVFEFSFVFRPETMLMCFVFFAWIFLEKIIENDHPARSAFFMGLFSGLAVATHLNGLFPAAAGGIVLLLYYRKYLAAFLPGLFLTSAIYFYDFDANYNFVFWWYQIAHSPFISVNSHSVLSFIGMNILEEQMRFFNSPKEFTLTLLSLFSFYLLLKSKTKISKVKLIYVLSMIVLMGVFSAHKTSKYMMLYLPFFVLVITKAAVLLEKRRKGFPKWNTIVFIVLLIGYFVANTIFNVNLSTKKYYASGTKETLKKYISEDFSRLNIVAPMTYIFNNIGDFGRIHSDLYYTEAHTKLHKNLVDEALKFNIDYIFLENYPLKQLGMENCKKSDTIGAYVVIDKSPDLFVMKKMK